MRRRDLRKCDKYGKCSDLCGTILVDCIFVNELCMEWSETERAEFSKLLSGVLHSLSDEAFQYNVELRLLTTYNEMQLSYKNDACITRSYITDYYESRGKTSLNDVADTLKERYDSAERVVFVFVLRDTPKAFVTHYGENGPDSNVAEFIAFPFTENSPKQAALFKHEFLHLFGACDFFFPDEIHRYAKRYFNDSIMLAGSATDPVTRYIIGWGKSFSREAQMLFDKLESLSDRFVAEELLRYNDTDYSELYCIYGFYRGAMKNGFFHGKGRLEEYDGSIYEGDFLDGRFDGKGKYSWAGNKYKGEFRNGKFGGQGKLTLKDGHVYEGDFRDGKYHGEGILTWGVSSYTGEFKEGLFSGYGRLIWEIGHIYRGEFLKGEYHGKGTLTREGNLYVGEFKNGRFCGHGRVVWENDSIYEGDFVDNQYHGCGVLTWDGNKYTGEFRYGKFNGQGTLKLKKRHIYTGWFMNDKYHGSGTLTWNGNKYVGEFRNGEFNGAGELIKKNGTIQSGEFRNGKFIG